MPARLIVLVAVLGGTTLACAQDILHYKFETGSGGTEINYGDPTPGIPRIGQVVAVGGLPLSQAWGPGAFGTVGLAAGPVAPHSGFEIDTGWDDVVGPGMDLTVAFFFKAVHPIPSSEIANMCGPVSGNQWINLSINGQPGSFGHIRLGWSGSGLGVNSTLMQDVLTPAFANWVHVAVVVDRAGNPNCHTATVQWYVDGVPQTPQAIGGCWHNIAGSPLQTFRIGRKDDAYFRYDDWRVSLRVVPPAEILQWATTDLAADAPFGEACHPFGLPVLLWNSGGEPTPGNSGYKLVAYGLPGSSVHLGLGFSNTSYAGIALPIDLGALDPQLAGCLLRASPDLVVSSTITAFGTAVFSLPIPAMPALVGMDAYAQAAIFTPISGAWSSTNAWAMHFGN